ncbi:MAG: lysoplasmalogenase [Lachnospiraceae bacterium]|nr:lysoplasmalogenase [Lachnospiraceae bacterium]
MGGKEMIPIVAYVLCIVGLAVQASFIAAENKEKYVPAVILKGSASFIFVIIGLIAFRSVSDTAFGKMVVLGLLFGALGDILLNLRYLSEKNGQKIFLAGIAVFLTGHIMYLVALLPLSDNPAVPVIAGAVCAALLLAYIFRTMTVKKAFKIFGIFYVGAIMIMTAVAIGNVISVQTGGRILFAVGAVLFTISDIILIFNTFGGKSTLLWRVVNLFCYYAGQLLIACSVFLM